jgi:hypothetical protein
MGVLLRLCQIHRSGFCRRDIYFVHQKQMPHKLNNNLHLTTKTEFVIFELVTVQMDRIVLLFRNHFCVLQDAYTVIELHL